MKTQDIVNYTKRNVTVIVGIATFIVSIIGGTIVVEDRYAKAADLQEVAAKADRSLDLLYKRQLEDKLFELRLKPNPTQVDRALSRP
jgi:hypothetical protein